MSNEQKQPQVNIRANDEDFGSHAVLDKLRSGDKSIEETGTRSGKVKAPRISRADLVLNNACRRRKEHVRRGGRDNDDVDFRRLDLPMSQHCLNSTHTKI